MRRSCPLWLSSAGVLVPMLVFLLEVRCPARSQTTFFAGFSVGLLFGRTIEIAVAMWATIDDSRFVPRLM